MTQKAGNLSYIQILCYFVEKVIIISICIYVVIVDYTGSCYPNFSDDQVWVRLQPRVSRNPTGWCRCSAPTGRYSNGVPRLPLVSQWSVHRVHGPVSEAAEGLRHVQRPSKGPGEPRCWTRGGMTISRSSDHGPYNVTTFSMGTSNALERRHRFDVWLLLSSARFGGKSHPDGPGGVPPKENKSLMVYLQQKAHLNHGCLWRCNNRANSGWLGLRHIFAILMMKSFRITIPNEKPWFHMDFFRSSDHISAGVCCPNAPCTSMYIHVRYLFIRRTRIILLVVVFCPMTSPSVPHFVYHIPWWNPSFWLQPPKYAQIDVVGCLLHGIPMYPPKLVIQTHHSDGFVWEFAFSLWTSHLWDIPIYLDTPHFQTDILP